MERLRALLERHGDGTDKLYIDLFVADQRDFPDEERADSVFCRIEGTPASLKFLGELLISFAAVDSDTSYHLHPEGAGSAHFEPGSKVGLVFEKKLASGKERNGHTARR